MNIHAIIFDMDGVLIDSEKIWQQHEMGFLKTFVPEFPDEMHADILGRSIFGIFDLLVERFPGKVSSDEKEYFLQEYRKFGDENIYQKTNLTPYTKEVLEKFSPLYAIGLASSSPFDWINTTLDRHEIREYFQVCSSGEEVKNAKPDPEIFLLTADRLCVDPKNCLVIEDTKNGIFSAKAAGMSVLGFRNGFNEEQDLSQADGVIESFLEIAESIGNERVNMG